MDRRAALRLAVAMYTAQVLASAVVVALTPHSSSGGLADFRFYSALGDWIAIRLPLTAAVAATLVGAFMRSRSPGPPVIVQLGLLHRLAALLRVVSTGLGIACGSLTVGLVSWMFALRIEATPRFFSHYLDWPAQSIGFTLVTAVTIGLVSVVFAFEADDAPRAVYFALCFGLLAIFAVMSAMAYDVVGATYLWPAMTALAASGLTLVTAARRLRTLLAIVLAVIAAAVLFVTVFELHAAGPVAIALVALQALSVRWLMMPTGRYAPARPS